jgi:hypothetical protein
MQEKTEKRKKPFKFKRSNTFGKPKRKEAVSYFKPEIASALKSVLANRIQLLLFPMIFKSKPWKRLRRRIVWLSRPQVREKHGLRGKRFYPRWRRAVAPGMPRP